jgi:hypothetical protein
MSLLYDDRPVPSHIRTRVGVPLLRISFGAPGSLSEPGQYEYEISPEDRAMIEQVIEHNSSPDELKKKAALHAWSDALWKVAPTLGPLMLVTFAAQGTSLLLDFLGKRVLQPFDLNPESGILFADNGDWAAVLTGLSVSEPDSNGQAVVSVSAAYTALNWTCTSGVTAGEEVTQYNSKVIGVAVSNLPVGTNLNDATGGTVEVAGSFESQGCPFPGYNVIDINTGTPRWHSQYSDNVAVGMSLGDCVSAYIYDVSGTLATLMQSVCTGQSYDGSRPGTLGSPQDLGDIPDPADLPFDKSMMEQLLPLIEDSEWFEKYYDPPLEDHPKNPNWPCLPPGSQAPTPEVPRVILNGPGFRVPRPPGFDPPGRPGDEMCIVIGGRRQCGKIRRMPPPGEDIIVERPPFRDERFTKPWCPKKGTLIVNLVMQLAEELGFDPGESGWIVDTDCKKRWPGGCFARGSSKFDAMWKLADMCGDTFSLDPPHIGRITPLPPNPRTYGPYHEHLDLFVFEATQDDLDIPSHVEVYVPHYPGQRGYSAVIEANTPYKLKDKWLRIRAPKNMSEAAAMDWAAKKARQYEIIASLTDYAIPYEQGQYVQQRTQMKLRIPSEGYDGRFMVWEFSHDIDTEDGAVTKIRGVELSRERYAPRFESYADVWKNAPAGYEVMR